MLTQPVAAYKSARLEPGSKSAHVADAPDEDDDNNDAAALPPTESLPADFFDTPDDDEGGRFFGGGVNEKQAEILDYIDAQDVDAPAVETIDVAWLRRKALGFERLITKNSEQRGKWADEPHRFMESEEALDAEVKTWSILAEHPGLFTEFRKLGTLGSLVKLLAHENTDVVVDVVEVVSELTDDEVEAEPEQWKELVDGMVEEGLVELLAGNLTRFNESTDSDRNGVYHTLSTCSGTARERS